MKTKRELLKEIRELIVQKEALIMDISRLEHIRGKLADTMKANIDVIEFKSRTIKERI